MKNIFFIKNIIMFSYDENQDLLVIKKTVQIKINIIKMASTTMAHFLKIVNSPMSIYFYFSLTIFF